MLTQPIARDYQVFIVTAQYPEGGTVTSTTLDVEEAQHDIATMVKAGAEVTMKQGVDWRAYDAAKATHTLYLALIRDTEAELRRIKEIASQTKYKAQLDRLRKQYVAVRHGAFVDALIEKARRQKTNAAYTARWTTGRQYNEQTGLMRHALDQIAQLEQIKREWPSFDITGTAMIETTRSAIMDDHAATAAACEHARKREYKAQATTIITTTPELVQPDWDKVMASDDINREVNKLLYTEPRSIGDLRLFKRVAAKRYKDMLDQQLTDGGTLSYELLVEAGFDMATEA